MNNSPSILIADDSEINRLLCQSQLEHFSKNTTLASNGEIALNYALKNQYNLIFIDIQMPQFDEINFVNSIKLPGSINQFTPVIAMSTDPIDHWQYEITKTLFKDYLVKPISYTHIQTIVDTFLPHPVIDELHNDELVDYAFLLLQKTSGNIELATLIFNKLFIDLAEQIILIEQALKANNLILAKDITHKINGSASFCCFSDIAFLANTLEKNLSINKTHEIYFDFEQLSSKVSHFLKRKESILIQLKTL